jgi:hypothetical protein
LAERLRGLRRLLGSLNRSDDEMDGSESRVLLLHSSQRAETSLYVGGADCKQACGCQPRLQSLYDSAIGVMPLPTGNVFAFGRTGLKGHGSPLQSN